MEEEEVSKWRQVKESFSHPAYSVDSYSLTQFSETNI